MSIAPSPNLRVLPPPLKPFLKWAGGKRQLLPTILEHHLPGDWRGYYEPFIGAGALLLALQPGRATIGDRNGELINCYCTVRDRLPELVAALETHCNRAEYYYEVRQWDRRGDFADRCSVERAARFIFLNKTCYNGLFRVNRQGQFNVPFGRYHAPKIVDGSVLVAVQEYLGANEVDIAQRDFEETVALAGAGDFVYFDPPYDPLSATASFTEYGAEGFGRGEQLRLREVFGELDRRGCRVMLSNSATEFIMDLYRDYSIEVVGATRAISSDTSKRGKVPEVLIKNYAFFDG